MEANYEKEDFAEEAAKTKRFLLKSNISIALKAEN